MKYLKTYETFKEKIKKLIPETYIVFEYEIFNFETYKKGKYLILAKNHSVKPYEEEGNYFTEMYTIDYITNDKNNKNADYILNKKSKPFNVDMMKIKFTSPSLNKSKEEYEKLKEDFLIKIDSNKYNL